MVILGNIRSMEPVPREHCDNLARRFVSAAFVPPAGEAARIDDRHPCACLSGHSVDQVGLRPARSPEASPAADAARASGARMAGLVARAAALDGRRQSRSRRTSADPSPRCATANVTLGRRGRDAIEHIEASGHAKPKVNVEAVSALVPVDTFEQETVRASETGPLDRATHEFAPEPFAPHRGHDTETATPADVVPNREQAYAERFAIVSRATTDADGRHARPRASCRTALPRSGPERCSPETPPRMPSRQASMRRSRQVRIGCPRAP